MMENFKDKEIVKQSDSDPSRLSESLSEVLQTKDIFSVQKFSYRDRVRNLDVESSGEVKSSKHFPVYLDASGKEQIFKPLSKTKPYLTPLFAYSEVFWSNNIHQYFDVSAPVYQLAICEGITQDQPKYYEKGTIVPSILSSDQTLVNLLEYFRKNPDPNVDIDSYINYCMIPYDYIPILKSKLFSEHKELSEQLIQQILLSFLMKNQNFHYENLAFVYEGDTLRFLAPPIDHEFSSFFMFPDDQKQYNFYSNAYTLSLAHPSGVVFQNLLYIVKKYPEVSQQFLLSLQNFSQDLAKEKFFLGGNEYLEACNSQEFEIGHARFKEMDEEKAKRLEQKIEKRVIDIQSFFDSFRNDLLDHIDLLSSLMKLIQKA